MRIQHRYLTYNKEEELTSLLNKLAVKHKITEKSYDTTTHLYALEFHLYEDNPRFSALKDALNHFGIEPQIGTIYEKDDMEKAEWFIASPGEYQYPQPEENFGYLNTTFDLEHYCSVCGIGKVQKASYRLKTEPKQFNNQFWGLHWEFEPVFVRQQAKNILEKEIQGVSFLNPILHKKGKPIEGFFQIQVSAVLKKGFDSYNTRIITCKTNNEENLNTDGNSKCCGRIKYHHPMIGGYLFESSIFNPHIDIAYTNEYFGSGASANRLLVVSKRFWCLVNRNKLKGLSFTPIVHGRLER